MDYHLIIKTENNQNRKSSFSIGVHPEIDDYIAKLSIDKLEQITINKNTVLELKQEIEKNLTIFFHYEYKDKESILKQILRMNFDGKVYCLNMLDFKEREIIRSLELFYILHDAIQSNGDIIIYGKNYLSYDLLSILIFINDEGITNIPDLIKRVDSVRQPNFNAQTAIEELQKKEFIIIENDIISVYEKGRINYR